MGPTVSTIPRSSTARARARIQSPAEQPFAAASPILLGQKDWFAATPEGRPPFKSSIAATKLGQPPARVAAARAVDRNRTSNRARDAGRLGTVCGRPAGSRRGRKSQPQPSPQSEGQSLARPPRRAIADRAPLSRRSRTAKRSATPAIKRGSGAFRTVIAATGFEFTEDRSSS